MIREMTPAWSISREHHGRSLCFVVAPVSEHNIDLVLSSQVFIFIFRRQFCLAEGLLACTSVGGFPGHGEEEEETRTSRGGAASAAA